MTANPKRQRVGVLLGVGLVSLGAWAFLLYRYNWTLYWVGIAAIGVTFAMMGVLLYSYVTRRGIANVAFALSIASLILGIIAMALIIF